jgi:uncharacterized membrane protein YraQ (UPF0718 family)/regulator of protease activity HflC (stomatin/prohibitin superfamily)
MLDFLLNVVTQIGVVFYEGSLYILIGFVIAGLLAEFVPSNVVARHLGGNDFRSVTLAALFGAPIPLCSCGVLPAAASLRKHGASKPATMSFLISTPETGVDSIALTYGLLGPVMAVVRPVVAVTTAMVAGMLATTIEDDERDERFEAQVAELGHDHASHQAGACADDEHGAIAPMGRVRRILRYGFVTLLDELAFWMIFGIALTGLISATLPDDFFTRVVGWDGGIVPMLAMMAVGIPLYLCASASTPVAAALLAKGLSPGAALVFLLAGPAASAASIAVVGRLLGRQRLKVYLGSIVVVTLSAGLLLDAFGGDAVRATVFAADRPTDSAAFAAVKTAAAVLFVLILVASAMRTGLRDGVRDLREQVRALGHGIRTLSWRDLVTGPTLAAAAVIAALLIGPNVTLVVEPGQRGIVRTFGRVGGEALPPGIHFHLPSPLGSGETVDVDWVREVGVGFRGAVSGRRGGVEDSAFYLTADENILDVRSVVHFRVTDPLAYALAATDVEATVQALARATLVDLLAGRPIDALYTTERKRIEHAAVTALSRASRGLGVEIVALRLLDVHAPGDVHDAFRDVASALEDRVREVRDAQGYAAEQAATATGIGTELREGAAATAAETSAAARGRAASFAGITVAHAASPQLTELRLYLEALERSIVRSRKYVNGTSGTGGDVDLWLGARGATRMPLPPSTEGTRPP